MGAFFADDAMLATLPTLPRLEVDGGNAEAVDVAPAFVFVFVPEFVPGEACATPGGVTASAVFCAAVFPTERPIHDGLRQTMTAIPQHVTSTSIATKATSFCLAEGPRRRTTIVCARGRRGRLTIGTVCFIAPLFAEAGTAGALNCGGVKGCDGCGCAGGGAAAAGICAVTESDAGMWPLEAARRAIGAAIGVVVCRSSVTGTSSTMTAGTFGSSTGARVGGIVWGRDEA